MARHESDREDLLAEASGLSPRAEWNWNGLVVTSGIRRSGAVSIYIGGDLMYQFDAAGRLRRALANGRLYRTQGHTLAELTRVRTPAQTQLQRRDLEAEETRRMLETARMQIVDFLAAARDGAACIGRQVPDERASVAVLEALRTSGVHHALAPAIRG